MRRLGLAVILAGALGTIPAMFLTYVEFGGRSFNWWEYQNGFDIALGAGCVVAAVLALAALVVRHSLIPRLAVIAAGMVFGFTFASVPGAIDVGGEGIKPSIWIIGGTGALVLAGALLVAISRTD